MKTTRYHMGAALALALVGGLSAAAQSNRVPGPNDYAQFSSFITDRNIFNPSRFSHTERQIQTGPTPPRYAPSFTLVGTMSYEKGMFAFFDGNQSNLRKVLYQSDSNGIAGFTVAEITPAGVTLQSADKKTVPMKIGQGMRQEGGSWQMIAQGGYFGGGGSSSFGGGHNSRNRDFGGGFNSGNRGDYGGSGSTESMTPPPADNSSPDTGATPSPAIEGSDVLKRLMQQRQQELK